VLIDKLHCHSIDIKRWSDSNVQLKPSKEQHMDEMTN